MKLHTININHNMKGFSFFLNPLLSHTLPSQCLPLSPSSLEEEILVTHLMLIITYHWFHPPPPFLSHTLLPSQSLPLSHPPPSPSCSNLHCSGISVTSQDEMKGVLPYHGGLDTEEGVSCLLQAHSTPQVCILTRHLDEELSELTVEPPFFQNLSQEKGSTQTKVNRPIQCTGKVHVCHSIGQSVHKYVLGTKHYTQAPGISAKGKYRRILGQFY